MTGKNLFSAANRESTEQALFNTAKQRLYPPLTDANYLVLRSRRLIFSKWANQFKVKNLTILDIGGRYQPYRPLFANVSQYVAIDLIQTSLVSVMGSGEALPFAGETFDVVIATQVMEYFRDPTQAAKQIHAVLKPGGAFLASVAACAPRFVDEECWRFTRPGLRAVLEPFAKVEIVPELYSLGSLIRTMNLALNMFMRPSFARAIYQRTACPVFNLLGLGIERLKLTSNDQFAANYSVLAVKANRDSPST